MSLSDKLILPDEPSTNATSTSTIKLEEKEKPRHSDSGQEIKSRRDAMGVQLSPNRAAAGELSSFSSSDTVEVVDGPVK